MEIILGVCYKYSLKWAVQKTWKGKGNVRVKKYQLMFTL
jgi:hypothetical protein